LKGGQSNKGPHESNQEKTKKGTVKAGVFLGINITKHRTDTGANSWQERRTKEAKGPTMKVGQRRTQRPPEPHA
jgi:hypothetical protein